MYGSKIRPKPTKYTVRSLNKGLLKSTLGHADQHCQQHANTCQDLRAEVVKICAFLEKDLTDEDIDRVVKMSTFKNMKFDPKANYKDLVESESYKSVTMRKGATLTEFLFCSSLMFWLLEILSSSC